MLKALISSGLRPSFVVGASVGAINGTFFAADPTPAGVQHLETIWRSLRRGDVFPIRPLQGLLGFVSRRNYLVSSGPFARLLEGSFPVERLEQTEIPCHVVATDLLDGSVVTLSSGPVVDALLASTAIPGIFPPVQLDGRFLVDGGVASNTPIATAVSLGAKRLIVLPTGFSCSLTRPPGGVVGTALHALNLLINRELAEDMDRVSGRVKRIVLPPVCPLTVSAYDFSQTAELIERSEDLTTRWLEGGGLEKDEIPASLRPHNHSRSRT